MTTIEIASHLERRQDQKVRICKDPSGYKVCGVCTSIAFKDAPFCPLCHSFRWHEDPVIVEVVATFAAKFPLPLTAAVAPRVKP